MPDRTMSRKEEKEKKKKARGAFMLWLKRLRAACKTIGTADEWYSLMKELTDLLQEYAPVIPADCYARIEKAMHPVDTTRKGLKQACKVLSLEIEDTIKCLHTGGSAGKVLGGTLLGLAVLVGAAFIYGEVTSVEIAIINDGCSTIVLPGELPIPIPGVSLPGAPIPPGGSETVSLPRLTVDVDATQPGRISVGVLGASVSYNLGSELTSIQLDGQEILGQRVKVSLGGRKSHELVVRCGRK
jgi:hypothetical protein